MNQTETYKRKDDLLVDDWYLVGDHSDEGRVASRDRSSPSHFDSTKIQLIEITIKKP